MISKTNHYVFIGLHVVAWIIFVALCIEAGALIVNFVFSLFKPEIIKNLYQKLDLSEIYNYSERLYFAMYSFILVISVLKAYLFYLVIRLLSKLDLSKPFNSYVSKQIAHISYYTLSIGIIGFIARESSKKLMHQGFNTDTLNNFWSDSQAFVLMSAVIYIIAVIFAKGVEIQEENDLTV